MKIKSIALTMLVALFLGGCVQDDLTPQQVQLDRRAKKGDLISVLGLPCPAAMSVTGNNGVAVNVTSNGSPVASFTSTDFTTLETNTEYFFDVPPGATVTTCSCGETYETLTGGPFSSILNTSNDPTPASNCTILSEPCPTAMYVTGNNGAPVIVTLNGVQVTSFTATDYTTLLTSTEYQFDIPPGASVTICSCGENYVTLNGGPFGSLLNTSSNPTSYSTCAF